MRFSVDSPTGVVYSSVRHSGEAEDSTPPLLLRRRIRIDTFTLVAGMRYDGVGGKSMLLTGELCLAGAVGAERLHTDRGVVGGEHGLEHFQLERKA